MKDKLKNAVKATVFMGAVFVAAAVLQEIAERLDGNES